MSSWQSIVVDHVYFLPLLFVISSIAKFFLELFILFNLKELQRRGLSLQSSTQIQLNSRLPCQPSPGVEIRIHCLQFSQTHKARETQYLLSNSQPFPVKKLKEKKLNYQERSEDKKITNVNRVYMHFNSQVYLHTRRSIETLNSWKRTMLHSLFQ